MKLDVKFQDNITPFDLGFSETSDALPVNFGSVQQVTELIPGADGKSAYEIAIENGFEGTETEWLDSLQGEDGVDGKDGKPGADGKNGIDGTPCTHRWSGTTLYVTSASGTTSANLKGDKGEKGDTGSQGIQGVQGAKGDKGDKGDRGEQGIQGANGKDGYTPVKGIDYFDGKDGAKGDKGDKGEDGANGKDGKDGADGYTPIKGTDYFTEADKAEMVSAVISALPIYNGEVVAV